MPQALQCYAVKTAKSQIDDVALLPPFFLYDSLEKLVEGLAP